MSTTIRATRGHEHLHRVKAIPGSRFPIGNNCGRMSGWILAGAIFGRCVQIAD